MIGVRTSACDKDGKPLGTTDGMIYCECGSCVWDAAHMLMRAPHPEGIIGQKSIQMRPVFVCRTCRKELVV